MAETERLRERCVELEARAATLAEELERRSAQHIEETVALTALCEDAIQALSGTPSGLVRTAQGELRVRLRLNDMLVVRLRARRWVFPWTNALDRRLRGEIHAVAKSPLFDGQWYLQTYPDVRAAGLDPARHFVTHGLYEGRLPSRDFDPILYYLRHPEVLEAGLNAVLVAGRNDLQPVFAETGPDTR